jgi:hypothetical protein
MREHAELASAVSEGPLSLRAESTKLRLVVAPEDLPPRPVGSGKLHDRRSSYGYIGSHLALSIHQHRRGRPRSPEGSSDGEVLVKDHRRAQALLPVCLLRSGRDYQ